MSISKIQGQAHKTFPLCAKTRHVYYILWICIIRPYQCNEINKISNARKPYNLFTVFDSAVYL